MLRWPVLGIFIIALTSIYAQRDIEAMLNKADIVYDENPAESFALCERAEREAQNSGDHTFDGAISICKARYYLLIAKYDAASRELNQAILIYQQQKDTSNLTVALSLKNILLSKIGKKQEAHALLLKVIELNRQSGDIDRLINNLMNVSLDYYRMNRADSMKYVLQQVTELKDHFYPRNYLYYYQNWGNYYVLTQNYQKAIDFFTLAIEVAEKEKMTDSKATNLAALGKAYRLSGNINLAEKYVEKSYAFSQEHNLIFESNEALLEWIKIKELKGDFKGAFEVQKKWIRVDKEINDIERIQKVEAMESQLNLVEKEKEIAESQIALQKSNLLAQKTKTRNAWLIGGILLMVVLLFYTLFVYRRTKQLNQTIQKKKEEVELKSFELETALVNIQDSLQYSKLIQNTMLPSQNIFKKAFKDYFILFKPKDYVSGDFYWIHKTKDSVFFAVGDCTGHGVPGAMVSIVCNEAINKVIKEKKVADPGEILNQVREIVSNTFHTDHQELNDGMDLALCKIETNKLSFAGANNPVWIFTEKPVPVENEDDHIKKTPFENVTLIELKADKQPIGKYIRTTPFTTKSVTINEGDKIYLFSDGYSDQFGGDKGKKLKTSNFKVILSKAQMLQIADQKHYLDHIFSEWRGEYEQLDDVCVIGVRV